MTANVLPFQRPPPKEPPKDYRSRLVMEQDRQGNDRIVHCKANAVTILRGHPRWAGVLGWDQFSHAVVCRRPAPWYPDDAPPSNDPMRPWDESDGDRTQNWFIRSEWQMKVSESESYRAANLVALGSPFNPLIDELESFQHDRLPRIHRWLHTYFGTEDTPYTRLVSRLFAIGSIKRAYEPGCKFDTMLVLEGDQGIGKSFGIKALYGPAYFRESPIDLSSNDRFLALRGCWAREWPELDGHGKADERRVKSFLSAQVDDFRAPYARGYTHQPRACVLIATVNPPQLGYLVDETGNRRMLPVVCGVTMREVDVAGLERDRAQLWAEARDMYKAGALSYAARPEERALCNGEQVARLESEVWEGKIADWIESTDRGLPREQVTIRQIMGTDCLNIPTERQDKRGQQRVGAVLRRLGWVIGGQKGSGKRERYYVRKEETTERDPDAEAREEDAR